jgi:hypothetical protein
MRNLSKHEKNVSFVHSISVVQFLAAPEGTKKKAMLSALETILQFSKIDVM